MVIWYVHPYAGGPGIGRYSRPFYLSKAVQSLGDEFIVISASEHHLLDFKKQPGFLDNEGVPYYFVDTPSYRGNGLSRLINMIKFTLNLIKKHQEIEKIRGKPDVIICSSPHPYAYLATAYLARKYNAKSCFEVRDLWPLSLVELAGVSTLHPLTVLTGWIEQFAYRKSDKVISLLPHTYEYMGSKGLDKEKWLYIPNGIDAAEGVTSNESKSSAAYKQLYKWHLEKQKVLIYAGGIGKPNNLEKLLEAFALLKEENIKLLIVGAGERESFLKSYAEKFKLTEYVKFFPQMNKKAAVDLMSKVDVCFISLLPEDIFRFGVSPNKLFDYMLVKKPIIYAVKASNDPVNEASCGFSCDPNSAEDIAEKIKQIFLLSEKERYKMGENGYRYVIENHSYKMLAEKLLHELKN